jgi:hypothetical protein
MVHCIKLCEEFPMTALPHKGAGAIGAPAWNATDTATPQANAALQFARNLPLASADAALAILAFAANQTVSGQVTLAHFLGDLAHAQAQQLSTTGVRAFPEGMLRDSVASIAALQARFADSVIEAANRYGRSCVHLAFAFPSPSRVGH